MIGILKILMLLKGLLAILRSNLKSGRKNKQTHNKMEENKKPNGVDLILSERIEQIQKHGFSMEIDAEKQSKGQLAELAEFILHHYKGGSVKPEWIPESFNKEMVERLLSKPAKDLLIKAGALIAAEIDRLTLGEENEAAKQNTTSETNAVNTGENNETKTVSRVYVFENGNKQVRLNENDFLDFLKVIPANSGLAFTVEEN